METPAELKRNQTIFLSFVIGNKFHFKNLMGLVVRILPEGHSYLVGIKFESVNDKKSLNEAIASIEAARNR